MGLIAVAVMGLMAIVFATSGRPKTETGSLETESRQVPKPEETPPVAATTDNNSAPTPAVAPFDARQARAHQEAWAKHLDTTVETTNSIGGKMVLIPPGEFLMGSTDEQVATSIELLTRIQIGPELQKSLENAERPQHRVVLSEPFLMGATEVTLGQFKAFVAATGYQTEAERAIAVQKKEQDTYLAPGGNVQDDFPVTVVSWNDANAFCDWLSKKEQVTYRLPTEAEWEFACRAGTTTQYAFGDNAEELENYAWYSRNAGGSVRSVGMKPPNEFGLYDLHGNAAEWCRDFYSETAYRTLPPSNPVGLTDGGRYRVMRGGGFSTTMIQCRSAFRTPELPNHTYRSKGFRIVREVNHSDANQFQASTHAPSQKDGWIDLLPLIDPQRDKLQVPGRTGKNDWQKRDGELTVVGDDFGGRLLLPANIVGPNVEVEFDVTRTAGASNVELHLPSDKGPIPVELSREGTTVYAGWPRAAIGKFSTKLGQRITYVCQLSKRDQLDVIDVFADGVPIGHWEGQRDAIAKEPEVKYPHGSRCVLIFLPKTDWKIHDIRVRTLGGSVEPLRAKSPIEANRSAPSRAKAPFTSMQARTHQETWAGYLNVSRETTNSGGGKMVLIPPGEFLMGSSDEQLGAIIKEVEQLNLGRETIDRILKQERPQHRVVLTRPFFLGATEVTIGQFKKFVEATGLKTYAETNPTDAQSRTYLKPGYPVTDESPVSCVRWDEAVAYCRWLSDIEKTNYRLPTEAEWEYACRAGTRTLWSWGDDPTLAEKFAWTQSNSESLAHPVASKQPNPFGVFDMHGNLSEWCQDSFDETWYAKSPVTDPISLLALNTNNARGGAFAHFAITRSAYRTGYGQGDFHPLIGFRVMREIDSPQEQPSADRRAAEWVIAQGGSVMVFGQEKWIIGTNDLPPSGLRLMHVKLGRSLSSPDTDLVPLRHLNNVVTVGMDSSNVSAEGIAGLESLPALEHVGLSGMRLSDERLTALARLKGLKQLGLHGVDLTPEQCATLARALPQLVHLNLSSNPPINDAALDALRQLPNLTLLELNGTQVTAAGVSALQQALPNCKIQWDGAAR